MENQSDTQNSNENLQDVSIKINTPKRVIHFSDGIIEEFDDGDETDTPKTVETDVIDTKSMTWVPWMKHYAWTGGSKVVEYCDYVGEGLANILGITTPKYQLELAEYERQQEAEKKKQEEIAGWNTNSGSTPLVMIQPAPNHATSSVEPSIVE